jgi:hypothetical protein
VVLHSDSNATWAPAVWDTATEELELLLDLREAHPAWKVRKRVAYAAAGMFFSLGAKGCCRSLACLVAIVFNRCLTPLRRSCPELIRMISVIGMKEMYG